jgi:hypothetical protein
MHPQHQNADSPRAGWRLRSRRFPTQYNTSRIDRRFAPWCSRILELCLSMRGPWSDCLYPRNRLFCCPIQQTSAGSATPGGVQPVPAQLSATQSLAPRPR